MTRIRTLLAVIVALALAGTLAGSRLARAQQSGIITIVEPSDDLLPSDNGFEGHVTVQVDTRATDPNAGVTLTFVVDGQQAESPSLGEIEAGSGVYEARLPISPCALPSHNDLPGTEVLVAVEARAYDRPLQADGTPPPEATLIGGELVNRVFTLAPDTLAPTVTFSPAADLQVRPGEALEIHVLAYDLEGRGHWASGLQAMQVVDSLSMTVGDVAFGDGPLPCESKRVAGALSQVYTVPADAREGEVIELIATVIDWAGNTTTGVMRLTVSEREEWEGNFTLRTEALDSSAGSVMWGEVHTGQFTFTLDRSINPSGNFGTGQGNGHATRMTYGGRDDLCTLSYSRPPENVDLIVYAGLIDGSFNLVLSDPAGSTATITATCQDAGTTTSSTPWEGDEAIHPFLITLPAEDGATFTIDERSDVWHYQGELTIRRRTPAPATSSTPEAAGD